MRERARAVTAAEVRRFARENPGGEMSVGGVAGLVARVTRDGSVSYAVRCRTSGGRLVTRTLDAATLADARDEAEGARVRVRQGDDPLDERRAARAAEADRRRAGERTFASVAEAWLRYVAEERRPGTLREYEGLLRRHWLPAFADRDPNGVLRREVRGVLNKVDATPAEARHAFVALRAMYSWARKERQEHLGVTADPLHGMEVDRRAPRDRTYSDDELRGIAAAIVGTGVEDLVTLIMHTGTRDEETRAMRWADVDWDRALWTIPASHSKSGRPHAVALSSGALEVLRRRPRFGAHAFENPRTRSGHDERDQKALSALGARLGFPLRLHDLRRTVGDRLRQEHGESVMHAALGHTDAALTRTYGPSPRLRVLAEAMEWWSEELRRVLVARPAPERGVL